MSRLKNSEKNGILQKGSMDLPFFIVVIVLLSIGILMLFTASYASAYFRYGNSTKFVSKQIIFAVVGVVAMLLISKIDYNIYKRLVWYLYSGSVFLLIVVLFITPPPGFDYKRWIYLGAFNIQPSEVAKFAIIVLLAYLISKNFSKMKKMTYVAVPFVLFVVPVCALTILEPHLSATIIIGLISVTMLIVGGANLKWVSIGFASAGVVLILLLLTTDVVSYATSRFQYWLDPWSDLQGKGWQVIQSLYAIGSGGFLGQGFGNSYQKHLYVSEPQNDFIFAIVCEELGFVGATVIIIIFGYFVYRGFVIAVRARDKFASLLVIGITFQVGLQVVLNMMVVTNTIPNTGISLPFFSSGGTSLLMLLGQMGVILSVSRSTTLQKQ